VIDWKKKGLELAEVVNRYRIKRFHSDMKLAGELARELIELSKKEREENAARN
jgi:hypothetical protein